MSAYYVINLCGGRLTDKQLKEISRPRFEITRHAAIKGLQFGAFGGCAVSALQCISENNLHNNDLVSWRTYRYGSTGLLIGGLLAPIATLWTLRGQTNQRVYEHALRLRTNERLLFVDRVSLLGVVAGLGFAVFLDSDIDRGTLFGFTSAALLATFIADSDDDSC